ncbi:MAG: helix-turn-helix transcriptional regulator [Lachnospiraceae bacterium]|nr:helix-turn-helix transcriptional regulator [Lachnospiraceae bacterium]
MSKERAVSGGFSALREKLRIYLGRYYRGEEDALLSAAPEEDFVPEKAEAPMPASEEQSSQEAPPFLRRKSSSRGGVMRTESLSGYADKQPRPGKLRREEVCREEFFRDEVCKDETERDEIGRDETDRDELCEDASAHFRPQVWNATEGGYFAALSDIGLHPGAEEDAEAAAPVPAAKKPRTPEAAAPAHAEKRPRTPEAAAPVPAAKKPRTPEAAAPAHAEKRPRTLEEAAAQVGETFQESLLRLIDQKGLTDAQVYKKAGIDRRHFAKIRKDREYQPGKKTAVALAVALELSADETADLLARAGYALSPGSLFDLIVQFFIEEKIYDFYTIDEALLSYDQPLLSAS